VKPKMKILVVGDWQNAIVTWACLGHIGHDVTLTHQTGGFPDGVAPTLDVHEPRLSDLVGEGTAAGRLHVFPATAGGPPGVFDAVWMAMDVPSNPDDGPDLSVLTQATEVYRGWAPRIVISSQVPIGTCRRIQDELLTPVAYVPENMRLGDGVRTFLNADRIVVGADDQDTQTRVAEMLDGISVASPIMRTNLATAEMIKHATNAWLATNISLANELAVLSEGRGVDMARVTAGLRADGRIGRRAPLVAGDGYGGTLARDVAVLANMPGATLLKAVRDVNRARLASRAMAVWKKERGEDKR